MAAKVEAVTSVACHVRNYLLPLANIPVGVLVQLWPLLFDLNGKCNVSTDSSKTA